MSDDERIDAPADLVTFVSRFVTLFKDGAENCAACCFCGSEGHGLRASDTAWRTFCCCQHEEHGGDAAGFYASWTGTTREEAVVALANGAGLPDAKPPVQVPLRVLPFWGVHALAKHPDARVWIHQLSGSVIVWRELLPDRVHLGLIPGRSWAELDIVALRHIVLVPEATEEGRALMRTLADCLYLSGHKKVMRLDTKGELPPDADAYGWAKVRSKPYPPPDEGQSALTNEAATQEPDREPRPLNPAEHAAAASPLNAVPDVVSAAGGPSPPASTPGPHPSKAAQVASGKPPAKGNGGAGPPLTPEQRVAQQRALARVETLGRVVYSKASSIKMRATEWLWPGKIPRGEICVIQGDPGLGKSQITASLCAIITKGGRWPVTREECDVGSVIVLSAEDSNAKTIVPRLAAAGADLDRVTILQAIRHEHGTRGFSLLADMLALEAVLDEQDNPMAIIIDPISAYQDTVGNNAKTHDSHKNTDVRSLLRPVSEMVDRRNCTMILINHLTKGAGRAITRGQGNMAFVAGPRAVWQVSKDKDDAKKRLFLPVKNNLADDSEETGLSFNVEAVDLGRDEDGKPIKTSRISWSNERVTISADEAASYDSLSTDERGSMQDAKAFLTEFLSDGPSKATDVLRAGAAAGHSHTTLTRAKRAMKVLSNREGFGHGSISYWRLPVAAGVPAPEESPASWVPD